MNKINIAIISADIYDIQGVNRVTENLIYGKKEFEKYGINLYCVFAGKHLIDCGNYEKSLIGSHVSDEKYIRKRTIVKILKRSKIYNQYFVQKIFHEKDLSFERAAVRNYFSSKQRADVLLFQNPYIFSAFIDKAKARKREITEKTIIIAHNQAKLTENLILNRPSLKSTRVEKRMLNKSEEALRNANDIIVLGHRAQEFFRQEYCLETNIIYNGVKDRYNQCTLKRHSVDNKIHIISVGAFLYRKGMDLFAEALCQMSESERDRFVIHIAGDGSDKEEIVKIINDNGLCNYFDILGAVSNVIDIIEQMDVFMLPTRFDSMPMAIIEAMMCSVPVISTRVGEIPQMISHEKSGLLIEPTKEAVTYSLKWLISNEAKLKQIGIESRNMYEKMFTLENMISQYSSVIQRQMD